MNLQQDAVIPPKRFPLNPVAFWWPLKDWRKLTSDEAIWCPGKRQEERGLPAYA